MAGETGEAVVFILGFICKQGLAWDEEAKRYCPHANMNTYLISPGLSAFFSFFIAAVRFAAVAVVAVRVATFVRAHIFW